MSINLDHVQALRFVGPDLGPNCLQMLSTDDTGRQRDNFDASSCQIAMIALMLLGISRRICGLFRLYTGTYNVY